MKSLPVDEGPLGVHEVKLVVEPGPGLHDGRGVGEAAHGPVHLCLATQSAAVTQSEIKIQDT